MLQARGFCKTGGKGRATTDWLEFAEGRKEPPPGTGLIRTVTERRNPKHERPAERKENV